MGLELNVERVMYVCAHLRGEEAAAHAEVEPLDVADGRRRGHAQHAPRAEALARREGRPAERERHGADREPRERDPRGRRALERDEDAAHGPAARGERARAAARRAQLS